MKDHENQPGVVQGGCGWLQVVTGDSQEEVLIFRDRQTDKHFIIIYISSSSSLAHPLAQVVLKMLGAEHLLLPLEERSASWRNSDYTEVYRWCVNERECDQQNHHLIIINILPVLFIIIIVVAIITMLTQFSFQQLDSKLSERLPSRAVVSSTGASSWEENKNKVTTRWEGPQSLSYHKQSLGTEKRWASVGTLMFNQILKSNQSYGDLPPLCVGPL